jgi:hypothetical protein
MITVIFLSGCFYIDEVRAVDDGLSERGGEAAWQSISNFQAGSIVQEG